MFILLLLVTAYVTRRILFIFVVALLFAYLLWPLVNYLDRRLPGRSKVAALALVYLLLTGVFIAMGVVVGSRVASEANAFATRVPELLSKLEKWAEPGTSDSVSTLKARALSTLRDQITFHSGELMSFLPKAVFSVLSHLEILLFIVLVPILSFFFLKDGPKLLNELLEIAAEHSRREKAAEILEDIHVLLAQYMRALVLLALATFVAYASFLLLLRAPYAILLAAVASPLEFIPIVGPLTAAVIIMLVEGSSGFSHLLWILVFLAAYRIFQDYVLQPHLLSAGMELPPLVIIFGAMAGGQIAGVAGSFLSVPVLAILRIIYRQLQHRSQPVCD